MTWRRIHAMTDTGGRRTIISSRLATFAAPDRALSPN